MLLFLAVSCIEEKFAAVFDAPTQISFGSAATEKSIVFNTSSSWYAKPSEDWLMITPYAGEAGEQEITISVAANEGYDQRTGEVIIYLDQYYDFDQSSHKIFVDQAEYLDLYLRNNEFFAGSKGAEISIPFSTNEEYECCVDDNCKDWISLIASKGMQDYTLRVSVAENKGYDSRVGKIRIKTANNEETITVTQSQLDEIIVSTKSYTIGSNGGEIKIPVHSNVDYNCEVLSSGNGWITVRNVQTKGLEEYYLVLNVAANSGYDGRVGQIKVSGAGKESIVTVTQSQLDEMIVSDTSFEMGSAGGSLTIPIHANVEYQSSVLSGGDWLSIEDIETKGLSLSSLKINVQENKNYDGRIGQIKVVGAGKESVITITQSQVDELIVSTTQFDIGSAGGSISVPVESNIEYQYEILSSGNDWIEVEEIQTKGLETSNLVLIVSPNAGYDSRVGQIKVSGAGKESIITITQSQLDAIIVEKTEYSISAMGGAIDIPIRSNVEYASEIVTGADWLQILPQTKALVSRNLKVSVAELVLEDSGIYLRTGQIKISGNNMEVIVTIRQRYESFDLSGNGTANCYIVSNAGYYSIPAVRGNSSESVGAVASAEVLWESFGTDVAPDVGDLISDVEYSDGKISFNASKMKGNAVIAAKDASGTILWSWHIWLTDKPQDQVYNNEAGTMMDRNLGATSATPGDVGALGLLYQWGRKDPFLGSSSISSSTKAKSTITWPEAVSSDSSNGTIAYATEHPTTFIISNYDWYYTGSSSTVNTRWQSSKTIYDPCPPGYRVPDGGSNGVWSKAFGTSSYFDQNAYDSTNEGFNFGSSVSTKKLTSSSSTCWYPAAGALFDGAGSLNSVGKVGFYWSCSPHNSSTCILDFDYNGLVAPFSHTYRANGLSVRCLKEISSGVDGSGTGNDWPDFQ